jgi:serine/threonine-protein kinase
MAAVQPENTIGVGALLAGKYKVTREIGRGGMAAVYEAENISIGKKVAVKVLASELANSSVVIERFFREARAAASVKSPHIVEVYDSGRLEDGRPFIAMELLEGESLYDRMARVRLIDTQTTVRIISQVAKGLMKAHAANIVHRDLKPENIHMCKGEDGEEIAKILDFGLAKFYAPVSTDEKSARLTREGAVFGTPAYMSPEQVKGQGNVDHRADLWALGCMAYECLTGRPVWNTDQGVAMTFAAIATGQLPVPSRMRGDLPPAFDAWFRKALERDPSKRYQTAKELADELARALNTAAPPISMTNLQALDDLEAEVAQNAYAIAGIEERQGSPSPRFSGADGPSSGPSGPLAPRASLPQSPPSSGRSREMAPSATDLPATAAPDKPPITLPPIRRGGGGRFAMSLFFLAAAGAGGWFLYTRVIHPASAKPQPSAAATQSAPSASATDAAAGSAVAMPDLPKWMATIEEGQEALATGDAEGALRKFKDASDAGGGALARSFLDQVKLGSATLGPCKMTAFSHPRLGYANNLGRPTVAATSKGAVVAWTDDHEQPNHDHVYSVLIDSAGRPTSHPRDLTPEADYAMRPSLLTVGDRVALLFWDKSGREPGVRVRWLDADGRIGGMSSVVSAAQPGLYWPAMDRAPDGSFWVTWQQGTSPEGENLFVRHLDAELKPLSGEVRATDYGGEKGKALKLTVPSVGVSSSNLFLAYALERDKQHLIERLRVPLNSPDLAAGLTGDSKTTRELGEAAVVNADKVGGDFPSLACGSDACFLVWQETDKGAEAALLDSAKGTVLWRKRFAPRGGHPAVGEAADGQAAEVAFYEAGRVRIAALSRDGVGTTSTFARVTGDQPRPWIAPGRAKGEWYVAWLDVEATHTETFVARLACSN